MELFIVESLSTSQKQNARWNTYVYVQMLHEDVVHSGKLNELVSTCDDGNTTIPTKSSPKTCPYLSRPITFTDDGFIKLQ